MPGYRAKKRLGQNFLKTAKIARRMVDLIDPSPDDTIIEIGPGRGALTLPLVESGAQIVAVEFDRDLVGYLTKLLSNYDNVRLHNVDFLEYSPDTDQLERFKLIGNLPYNITSPVIDWCQKYRDRIEVAAFMVQQEVAARIAADPGSKDWSPLAIFTQLSFEVEHAFDVHPKHFHPPPKVESSVLRMTPLEDQEMTSSEFEQVVRTAFRQRRKTLLNNLVPTLVPDADMAREILDELGLDYRTRAETLDLDQFLTLTSLLSERKLV